MKKDETNELLELGSAIKRGYSSIIQSSGKIIAIITLIVAVIVTFTDVALSSLGGEGFTTTLVIMLASSYLMYFSLEDAGEKEGENSEEYLSAKERYLLARGQITHKDIDPLRQFCLDYARRELEYRRLSYLGEMGYSENDLKKYKSGETFPQKARAAFRRAEKMRAVKLSPTVLLSRNHPSGKSELCDPAYKKLLASLFSLIPSTLCMIFTVSVMLTMKDGLTASAVVEGIVKLCTLPIIGFKGTLDGYRVAREDRSAWLETKSRLLETYLATKPHPSA